MSPLAAPHPCREVGCRALLPIGIDRCREHARAKDARRPTASQRGYDSKWQRESKAYLATHRMCVMPPCGARSTVVDHKIPHRGNQALFWNRRNWQALCGPCHSRKTALEDGGFGRSRRAVRDGGRAVEIPTAIAVPTIAQHRTRGRELGGGGSR